MNNTITREEIQRKINTNEPITLVEALPQKYYDAEHLPGAIHLPHDQVRELASQLLPDKNTLIAVYCASTECQNSRIATNLLEQLGYTNAHEYVGGKQDWMEAGLPIESNTAAARC